MNEEIWRQLCQGKTPPASETKRINGRLDLRNFHVAKPTRGKTVQTPLADITFLEGVTEIRGVNWQSIDFSFSNLEGVRIRDSRITDCLFEDCVLDRWHVWGTDFSNVSFRSASLWDALLGGVLDGGKINLFKNVDFSLSDLRRSFYVAAKFSSCNFSNANLEKVDFQSSNFEDCSFEGELREVLFYSKGFEGENFPRNRMKNVDFSRAKLRWVGFRGLDLEDVRFPEDDDHILIADPANSLKRLIKCFRAKPDVASRSLAAGFENALKWLGPNQKVAVFNKSDILEMDGEEALRAFLQVSEEFRFKKPPLGPDKAGACGL